MDFYYVPINYDTTLEELVADPLSVFSNYKNDISLLINGFKNDGESNFDRIIENYSADDLTSEAVKITTKQLSLIRANTSLFLPKGELSMDL